jgi:hypothetical protein
MVFIMKLLPETLGSNHFPSARKNVRVGQLAFCKGFERSVWIPPRARVSRYTTRFVYGIFSAKTGQFFAL